MAASFQPVRRRRRPRRGSLERPVSSQLYRSAFLVCSLPLLLAAPLSLAGAVRYEVAGMMTARRAEALDAEMQQFYRAAAEVTWMYKPSALNLWKPGFPEFLIFATLTCSPWRWERLRSRRR